MNKKRQKDVSDAIGPEGMRRVSLLAVDDEPLLLEFLRKSLNDMISDIYLCSSGEDALEVVKEHDVEIAIVDLALPGIDGITLIAELKRFHPEMLIAVLTGYVEDGSLREAVKAGAYDFLDKPIDKDGIRLAVGRYVEKIKTDQLFDQILRDLFILATGSSAESFDSLKPEKRAQHLQAMLGFIRMKLLRKDIGK